MGQEEEKEYVWPAPKLFWQELAKIRLANYTSNEVFKKLAQQTTQPLM